MSGISGFSNQKKLGGSQFVSVHSVGSDKFASPSPQLYLNELTPVAIAVTDVAVSDDQKKVYLEITAHSARKNDVLRVVSGNLIAWEFEIVEVVDANTIGILNIGEDDDGVNVLIAIADTVKTLRWVTATSDSNGSLSVTPGPTEFLRNGATTVVNEDLVTPANNRFLPVKTSVALKKYAKLDFSITNVTSAAFVELISTVGTSAIEKSQIFMSSGEPLEIAFGAAAAEVVQGYIFPGGNGFQDLNIPAGTRVSVRAVNAVTVNSGVLLVNFLG